MTTERETFSPLRITPPTETESKIIDADLLSTEDILTALCATEDGIAALATLLGYRKVAPTTKLHH